MHKPLTSLLDLILFLSISLPQSVNIIYKEGLTFNDTDYALEHEWKGVFKVPKLKDHWENFLATITLSYKIPVFYSGPKLPHP